MHSIEIKIKLFIKKQCGIQNIRKQYRNKIPTVLRNQDVWTENNKLIITNN